MQASPKAPATIRNVMIVPMAIPDLLVGTEVKALANEGVNIIGMPNPNIIKAIDRPRRDGVGKKPRKKQV